VQTTDLKVRCEAGFNAMVDSRIEVIAGVSAGVGVSRRRCVWQLRARRKVRA